VVNGKNKGERSTERRYYISSLSLSARADSKLKCNTTTNSKAFHVWDSTIQA
jgi:hypothetical protein